MYSKSDYLREVFNEVNYLTAICRHNFSWGDGEYPELEIGKAYKVTHIGVLRSRTDVLLEGFGEKEYNSICFDFYENGEPLSDFQYVSDARFLAPYLRDDCIKSYLHDIEREYGVKILIAAETGSRAMGLESPDSDWDVCYLFERIPEDVSVPREQSRLIKRVFGDKLETIGWELEDALSYLRKGNPTLLEWFHSPKLYIIDESFIDRAREMEQSHFQPHKAISYYNRAYNKLNERSLRHGDNLKAFIFYLRGVFACRWIERNGSLPPMSFTDLLDATVDDQEIRSKVNELVKLKKEGKAKEVVVDAGLIDTVRDWAEYYDGIVKSSPDNPDHKG